MQVHVRVRKRLHSPTEPRHSLATTGELCLFEAAMGCTLDTYACATVNGNSVQEIIYPNVVFSVFTQNNVKWVYLWLERERERMLLGRGIRVRNSTVPRSPFRTIRRSFDN